MFCVASLATLIFQRLRQPVVLGYLLAGLIIGPNVPIPPFVDLHQIELLSELGVILVVFAIGLEFRLAKLFAVLPTSGIVGALQVPGMLWLGYTLGTIAGWSGRESLFLGGMMCISSTMIVARVLGAQAEVDRRLSDSVFGILIVQDLAAIVLIAVFTAVASGAGIPAGEVARMVGELALFLVVSVVAGILVVPRLIREAHHRNSSEVLLIAAIATCFGLALIAHHLGYSVALGAFIAGSVIAESGRRQQVEHLIVPVRDLFAAVFFVSIGMLVDPLAMAENWQMIAAVSAAVVVGQSVFIGVGSVLAGRSVGIAVRSGMTLAQIGEFSFIIVGVGVGAGAIPSRLMAIAVGVSVVTTFLTPILVAASGRAAAGVERRLPRALQTFVALHGSWLESLRARGARSRNARLRPQIVLLAIDVVAIVGILVVMASYNDRVAHELSARTGLPLGVAGTLALGAGLLLALPFLVGMARAVRKLGSELARSALPKADAGVDLADAPRRALGLALELVVSLAVILPIIALTQPFLPLYVGAVVLVILLGLLGILFWRSASNLQGHVRAGAEVMLEMLDSQRRDDVSLAPPQAPPLTTLLPGLGPLLQIEIGPDSPAVGRTLAELNLRALTGASVVAMKRASGEGVGVPSGRETLSAGDVLMLTGSTDCVTRASRLLAGEELDPPGEAPPDRPGDAPGA